MCWSSLGRTGHHSRIAKIEGKVSCGGSRLIIKLSVKSEVVVTEVEKGVGFILTEQKVLVYSWHQIFPHLLLYNIPSVRHSLISALQEVFHPAFHVFLHQGPNLQKDLPDLNPDDLVLPVP